jgi:2-polyprenyl-6-hydroxyphenyl methylase/3-demethylubiquinone-9 3-methyltransferase
LRWVPAGTHDWNKFVRPSALAAALRNAGAVPQDAKGLVFNPLQNHFKISATDLDVNYFMVAIREKTS